MLAIETSELSKAFTSGRGRGRRTVEAVRDITFAVERGERLAYIGPNGAGKSTSIKMLTGILHPTRGEATVLGIVPWRRRRELARRIGTLFGQRSQLWLELSTRQTLRLLARIYRLEPAQARRRMEELGELLDARDLLDLPVRSPGPLRLDGVETSAESETLYQLVVDTRRRSVRSVLDALLDGYAIADISVVDPPLEQVIGEIYGGRR